MNARHIVHIREALWKRPERGACVMVGAGLSRQAEAGHPIGARPPTWTELAVFLQAGLRCAKPEKEPDSPAESVTARDCSRLAQQYKATFGQSALDSFLLERVPNGEPGSVHERLLRLPWTDVFTTNWDTLLEKAASRVVERTYDPVLRPADLATTVAPRIVKLHGSFPSSRPFVVAEEDYRTYPIQFAPLVNTVQQALMESIFLLVGFSGDDPNFLHWCGWVRDHLGPAAPRLYLAGALDLDRPSRLTLEERGVIPIDLSPEVSEAPTRDAKHRRAIDWILSSLEAGETREERWPFLPPETPDGGEDGIPLPVPPTDQPQEEPVGPSQGSRAEPLAEQVKNVSVVWRHNRRVYPGWPILPFSKYSQLLGATQGWIEPISKSISALSPPDRLTIVRELIERIELLMDPMTPDLAKAVTDTLTAVEEELTADTDGPEGRKNEIDQDRAALMLALLTDSRHDLDETAFNKWDRRLVRIVRPGTPAFHRLHHERCLWKLREQDCAGLGELLNAWSTGDTDPMWSLRKAALLVESGQVGDGQALARRTLQGVEQAWSRDGRVLTASRFGWALFWRHALNWARWWDELRQGNRSSQPGTDLWARLAPYDADAQSDLDSYVRQMTEEQREDSPWTFDLRRVKRVILSNAEYRSFRLAWRVVRLLELSGLPSAIPGVRIASDHFGKAARLVAPVVPTYAARLLLLGGVRDEKSLDAALSQTHLARMSDQEASSLFDAVQRARDDFLGRWTPGGVADDFLRGRAENAIEIMSRCVARHGVAPAAEIFTWALQYRRSRRWVDNPLWSCVTRLRQRSWDAMDLESRAGAVREILQAPIPDDAFITDDDPGDLLLDEQLRFTRADVDEPIWASCVQQICIALRGSDYARRLACDRLTPLARRQLLSAAEEEEVARSLWRAAHPEPPGLPQVRQVDDWVYLCLPEPETGIAERRFRAKWIGRDVNDATSETGTGTIRNVAAAWNPDYLGERMIRLTDDEEEWFWRFVEEWLHQESRRRLVGGTSRDPAVPLLLDLLTHRRAPTSVLQRLAENASHIPGRRTPFAEHWGSPEYEYLMIVASAALGGGDSSEAEYRLRVGARSPDGDASLAAWNARQWWIVRSGRDTGVSLIPPSVEDVRDIGVAIATSRQSGLVGALRTACAVYEGRNPEFIEAIHSQIIQGLSQLRSELEYGASAADRQIAEELPLRRSWCVWLACTLRDADRGDDDVVASWIEAGNNDPLCHVRFTRERYEASRSGHDTTE